LLLSSIRVPIEYTICRVELFNFVHSVITICQLQLAGCLLVLANNNNKCAELSDPRQGVRVRAMMARVDWNEF
jgi:hypothetical protein